jgi:hypothetical protein
VVEFELLALKNVSVTTSMDARARSDAGCNENMELLCTSIEIEVLR